MGSRSVRPSPSISAARMAVGARRIGNDGRMYEVRVSKTGVKRWVAVEAKSVQSNGRKVGDVKGHAIVTLRPRFLVYDAQGNDNEDVLLTGSSTATLLGLAVGHKALSVVMKAVSAAGCVVEDVLYHLKTRVYRVYVGHAAGSLQELKTEMKTHIEDIAADTWMEGDIRLSDRIELGLELVKVALS